MGIHLSHLPAMSLSPQMINQQTQTLRCDFIHIWALIKEERTMPHIPHTWQKVATKSWGWKKKRRKGKAAPLALDSRHKSCRLDRAHELYSVRYINHIAPDCQGFPCSAQVQQQGFRGPSQTAVPAPVGNYDALHFELGSLPQSSLWIEPRTIHKWNGSKVRIKYLLWTNSSLLTWTVSSLGAQQAQRFPTVITYQTLPRTVVLSKLVTHTVALCSFSWNTLLYL